MSFNQSRCLLIHARPVSDHQQFVASDPCVDHAAAISTIHLPTYRETPHTPTPLASTFTATSSASDHSNLPYVSGYPVHNRTVPSSSLYSTTNNQEVMVTGSVAGATTMLYERTTVDMANVHTNDYEIFARTANVPVILDGKYQRNSQHHDLSNNSDLSYSEHLQTSVQSVWPNTKLYGNSQGISPIPCKDPNTCPTGGHCNDVPVPCKDPNTCPTGGHCNDVPVPCKDPNTCPTGGHCNDVPVPCKDPNTYPTGGHCNDVPSKM